MSPNFEMVMHPIYSPDQAPYHLFGPLKDGLRGHRFIVDQELEEVLLVWVVTQPKKNFTLRSCRNLATKLNMFKG
jgi:hypothetical protein